MLALSVCLLFSPFYDTVRQQAQSASFSGTFYSNGMTKLSCRTGQVLGAHGANIQVLVKRDYTAGSVYVLLLTGEGYLPLFRRTDSSYSSW